MCVLSGEGVARWLHDDKPPGRDTGVKGVLMPLGQHKPVRCAGKGTRLAADKWCRVFGQLQLVGRKSRLQRLIVQVLRKQRRGPGSL